MSNSAITAPTQFLQTSKEKYAYRRFGKKSKYPLLFMQHFTGTLDNRDPAVTDPLAANHDIILFDNAGVGGSTGKVPTTMAGMAEHAAAFLGTLGIETCDVLGFSLGGVVAQQMALDNSKVFRKMVLVGTARAAVKISCTLKSRASRSSFTIPLSRDTRYCKRFSFRRRRRARRLARNSSDASCSVGKIGTR